MDKVQNKPNSSVQHTPSSESFQVQTAHCLIFFLVKLMVMCVVVIYAGFIFVIVNLSHQSKMINIIFQILYLLCTYIYSIYFIYA
jgi:uncharacterized protein YqhQ